MSENERKTRENGYYWVRSGPPNVGLPPFIVEVQGDQVFLTGSDDYYYLDNFDFEFIAGPLTPPEKP